jgi:site-specific DNA-methyltransferase (adenine-specific)
VLQGDCLDILPGLDAASIDAIVCDPPYGIAFKGHAWDAPAIHHAARGLSRREAFEAWTQAWAGECLRLLRPGGHLTAFGAPRTFHRLCRGVENAGLELRDVLLWLYGTGMPKSRRLAGGRGTALKPAYEPILLARRKPDSPIAHNIAAHGTGALNIDACRVGGRWPANVLLSHHPACTPTRCHARCPTTLVDAAAARGRQNPGRTDHPSRLFYCPKANRRERNAGCDRLPAHEFDLFPNSHGDANAPAAAANAHPTVKPLALMRWLVALTVPAGGLVLDPFCGSGTTGCAAVLEHRRFLGIEREEQYVAVARARLAHWSAQAERESVA